MEGVSSLQIAALLQLRRHLTGCLRCAMLRQIPESVSTLRIAALLQLRRDLAGCLPCRRLWKITEGVSTLRIADCGTPAAAH